MKLENLFSKSLLHLDLQAPDKAGIIRELLNLLAADGGLEESDVDKVSKAIMEREQQATTGIGKGLAIPHAKSCDCIDGIRGVFGRSLAGIPYNSIDGEPARIFFLVISSDSHADEHIEVMRKVARLGHDEKSVRFLAANANLDGVVDIFREIDEGQL